MTHQCRVLSKLFLCTILSTIKHFNVTNTVLYDILDTALTWLLQLPNNIVKEAFINYWEQTVVIRSSTGACLCKVKYS